MQHYTKIFDTSQHQFYATSCYIILYHATSICNIFHIIILYASKIYCIFNSANVTQTEFIAQFALLDRAFLTSYILEASYQGQIFYGFKYQKMIACLFNALMK